MKGVMTDCCSASVRPTPSGVDLRAVGGNGHAQEFRRIERTSPRRVGAPRSATEYLAIFVSRSLSSHRVSRKFWTEAFLAAHCANYSANRAARLIVLENLPQFWFWAGPVDGGLGLCS